MRHSGIDDQTFDKAGERLVRSLKQADAVDRVVSDPFLFARVKARIAESGSMTEHSRMAVSSVIARHRAAFAAGLVAVTGLALFATMQIGKTNVDVAKQVSDRSVVKIDKIADPISDPAFERPAVAMSDRVAQPHFEKAGLKRPIVSPPRQTRKRVETVTRTPDSQFYAVSYAGDMMDADSGGRIVRVQMSRSSLLAMGVNVPLENDSDAPVQADLLMGRDGSTRGIRFIK